MMKEKHTIRKGLLYILLLTVTLSLRAGNIRIVSESILLDKDSLRIDLLMNLSGVKTNSGASLTLTPLLRYGNNLLDLPAVIISGSRRARFDLREKELSLQTTQLQPYRVLIYNKHKESNPFHYRVSVPYASWMQHASLALKQESRDCCVTQLLAVETLSEHLSIQPVAALADTMPLMVPLPLPAEKKEVSVYNTGIQAVVPAFSMTGIEPLLMDGWESAVSWLTPDPDKTVKQRTAGATAYIDYHRAEYEVDLDYANNRQEVDKIDNLLSPFLSGNLSKLNHIYVCGYASPDGNYADNERLSYHRSRLFMHFIRDAYGIPEKLFSVSSVAEDWEGLRELLEQTQPAYRTEAIRIIDTYGIFAGREKQLMDLSGGTPYKEMLRTLFPRLRRIEVMVHYEVRPVNNVEAADLIYTHPQLLSLNEMYAVASFYRPGTEQYREVYEIAAYRYPNEVVANINAASAALLLGDLQSAWNYLRKVDSDPRSYNDMGILTWLEGDLAGAEVWFRKAIGLEPEKARKNLIRIQALRNKQNAKK